MKFWKLLEEFLCKNFEKFLKYFLKSFCSDFRVILNKFWETGR